MAESPGPQDYDLILRIRAEYREMRGLKLTLPQAARLFQLNERHCERVLGVLVEEGALAMSRGAFVLAGAGFRNA